MEIFQEGCSAHRGSWRGLRFPTLSFCPFLLPAAHSQPGGPESPHNPPADERWSRPYSATRPGPGVGLSPRWPTHRYGTKETTTRVPGFGLRISVTFLASAAGDSRASEELLACPPEVLGRIAAARTVTPAAPEKTGAVLAGAWSHHLPSSAAEPARLLRKFAVGAQGAIAWPPRSRAGARRRGRAS